MKIQRPNGEYKKLRLNENDYGNKITLSKSDKEKRLVSSTSGYKKK